MPSSSRLSDQARERLNDLWRMGGDRQVSYWPENNDSFIRARGFAQGKGRAYIGYSEALTARKSVYKTLSRDYPIYRRLEKIVDGKDNHVFRIGADARGFIKDMEEALSEQMDSE